MGLSQALRRRAGFISAGLSRMRRQKDRPTPDFAGATESLPPAISVRTSAPPTPPPTSRDPYTAFALRWSWLLVAGVILGLLGAFAYTRYGPIPYTSTALVMVQSQSDVSVDSMGSPTKLRAGAESYAGQMASAPIYDLVSRELTGTRRVSSTEIAQLVAQKKILIAPQKGTSLVSVSVTDTDPNFSMVVADKFAEVFVAYVNGQAKSELAERRRDLELQIDQTSQQLTASQLRQRSEDLQKELQGHRSTLLQLQMQYQQEIQRKATLERVQQLAAAAPTPTAVVDSSNVEELAESTAQARAQVLESLAQQQKNEEAALGNVGAQIEQVRQESRRTIAELTAQSGQIRNELASLSAQAQPEEDAAPASDPAAIQQQIIDLQGQIAALQQQQREVEVAAREAQGQVSQLQSREQALINQAEGQRNAARGFETQIQQERQRQVQMRQQANAGPIATSSMSKDQRNAIERQRNQARRSADAQIGVSNETISMLEQRKAEAEQQMSRTLNELGQVRQTLASLPDPRSGQSVVTDIQRQLAAHDQQLRVLQVDLRTAQTSAQTSQGRRAQLEQRDQAVQQQIREARAQLQQREQTLTNEAQNRRSRVLVLQTQYQQEVQRQTEQQQRQAEASQRQAETAATTTPTAPPDPQVLDTQARLHAQWLDVISAQIKDVQANIDHTTKRLATVQTTLEQYPSVADPSVASMFVGAYTTMMQSLTRDLVRLQLNEQTTAAPVLRYGDASTPVPNVSLRRAVVMGSAVGGGAAAVVAYLLQRLIDRRHVSGAHRRTASTDLLPAGSVVSTLDERFAAGRPEVSARERRAALRSRWKDQSTAQAALRGRAS